MTDDRQRTIRARFLWQTIDERRGDRHLPLLSVSGDRGVILRSQLTTDDPRADDLSNYKVCHPGDIVVNRMSAYQGALGRSRWVGIVSPDYVVLRPGWMVDSRWLHYLMRSTWFVSEMALRVRGIGSIGTGNVRTPRVSAEEIGGIVVPLPEAGKQRAIAEFLDSETARIDALVTKNLRMIELMSERLWHSVDSKFRALEHVPQHRLTWLAQTWCDGPFGSSLTSAHYSDFGARVVRLGNVGRGEFLNLDAAFVPVDYFESLRRHEVLEGDLIVAGLGDEKRPLARACVAPELGPAMVKADCFRFRLRRELVSPEFVAWYLSSPFAVARSALLAQGSTRARANLATVCGLRVPVPHQRVQQLVVESIQRERAAMTDVATRLKQQVKLLQERRQALITAVVTGRLEIPGVTA